MQITRKPKSAKARRKYRSKKQMGGKYVVQITQP